MSQGKSNPPRTGCGHCDGCFYDAGCEYHGPWCDCEWCRPNRLETENRALREEVERLKRLTIEPSVYTEDASTSLSDVGPEKAPLANRLTRIIGALKELGEAIAS